MSGDVAMREMVETLRKLGTLPEDAAKIAAPLVELEAKSFADKGISPQDGTVWAARKRDGKRALANASAALKAAAIGTLIRLTLAYPYSIHNFGDGHAPKRQQLPDAGSGIPGRFGAAILKACQKAFLDIIGSKRG